MRGFKGDCPLHPKNDHWLYSKIADAKLCEGCVAGGMYNPEISREMGSQYPDVFRKLITVPKVAGTATMSSCGLYRYILTREIPVSPDKGPLLFIMLNPSTADANVNDPTISRCIRFAVREQASQLMIVNLFGLRSTDPRNLYGHPNPAGPDNDNHLYTAIQAHPLDRIVAAWGNAEIAQAKGRKLRDHFGIFQCLGMNLNGSPKHPLYLKSDSPLIPWSQG